MTEPNQDGTRDQKSDSTLRDMLAPLFRHKRAFALTVCGSLLGTVVAAFVLNSMHKASMEILINEQRLDPSVTSESTQWQMAPPPVSLMSA